ncbi:Protein of unknown function D, partial [Prunus dulcis]
KGKVTTLIIYVDDMVITGNDKQEISQLQDYLVTEFEKKNLDLLTYTRMLDCKPVNTPIVQNHHLGEYSDQVQSNKEIYQSLHPKKGLCSQKHGHLNVDGYSYADWSGSVTDRRSTSGYFTFVGGNLVIWKSKKQNVVALSSAEAEFKGMTKGICELSWLRKLLTELRNLFCENQATIAIAQNSVQHDRTKHVEVDRHFIKHKLEAKVIQFPFVKSDDQLMDILTKAISSRAFHDSLEQLGISDIYVPT